MAAYTMKDHFITDVIGKQQECVAIGCVCSRWMDAIDGIYMYLYPMNEEWTDASSMLLVLRGRQCMHQMTSQGPILCNSRYSYDT